MGSRNCSFCGKELTDAASMNVGIGPVCRKMENHVLAQLIEADLGLAQFAYRRLNQETFVEAGTPHKTYALLADDLVDTSNKDWRSVCKRIEWLLSFDLPKSDRNCLISIIDALGYVSLASLLRGEVAKGETLISFHAGRLYLQGPRNKHGIKAIKAVKGRKFHPGTTTEKARWSVPATAYEELKTVVWKHYPKNKGLDEALKAAQEFATVPASAVEPAKPEPKPESKVVVVKEGAVLKITSPYNYKFIAALKSEISVWKERRWNPSEKVWEVAAVHADLVQTLVEQHYGEQVSI